LELARTRITTANLKTPDHVTKVLTGVLQNTNF